MSEYDFKLESDWRLPYSCAHVWAALREPTQWPLWWHEVEQATQIAEGDSDGIGNQYSLCWTSPTLYRVRFVSTVTAVETERRIVAAIDGDLCGRGEWQLQPDGAATRVRYVWQVRVTQRWMRLTLPLLRGLFVWNHNRVMALGEAGLHAYLAGQNRHE
ncbi:MAG: SRPBCC family protein [Rhodocyclaceae bacterium]|nr:SRPBCC family protein [Rhodocyclaceae bacterium]MBX3667086.1 SRPBCC family protein [Rhodocyclaceae bacterium]